MNRFQTLILLATAAVSLAGCLSPAALQPSREHRMVLNLPEAKEVIFLSSLNQYEPIWMHKTSGGAWEIDVPEDRAFDYFFRVDGKPFTPDCRLQQTDDWGGHQCIYNPGIERP